PQVLVHLGVQPQTLAVPPPPQVCGAVHVPHETVRGWLQLSSAVTPPQVLPSRRQNATSVSGVHTPTQVLLAPQLWGAVQLPQLTMRGTPQLSVALTGPQFLSRRWQS